MLFMPHTLSTSAVHRYAKKFEQGKAIVFVGLSHADMTAIVSDVSGAVHVSDVAPTIDILMLCIVNRAVFDQARVGRARLANTNDDVSPDVGDLSWCTTRETTEQDRLHHARLHMHKKNQCRRSRMVEAGAADGGTAPAHATFET